MRWTAAERWARTARACPCCSGALSASIVMLSGPGGLGPPEERHRSIAPRLRWQCVAKECRYTEDYVLEAGT